MKITTGIEKGKQRTNSDFHQYLATSTGSIAIICTGMHFGWPSPSLPLLLDENSHIPMTNSDGSWLAVMPCMGAVVGSLLLDENSHIPMTNSDGSWLAVMPCMGAVVGCFLAAYFVDKIGRRISMLVTSPLYFVAWIMVAYSTCVGILHSARFLAGIADGIAFTAFPMYLGEIAHSSIRGLLGSSIPVTTILGFLLINIIGSYLDIMSAALLSSVVPVLHFITFFFMPESPYYLLMSKKEEDAKNSLKIFRGVDDVSVELSRLSSAVAEDEKLTGSIWDLFTVKSNRKAVFIIMGIRAVQQLSGTTVITFYAKTIFRDAGSNLSSSTAAIIYFSIQLVVATLASILVDKTGRRPLLIFSIIGSGFALATEGIYIYLQNYTDIDMTSFQSIPVIALLVYVIVFNLGMGTIPLLLLGELFPTNVKAFALCLADIYFGIIVTAVSKFFQIMKDDFGMLYV
ncbi:Sugar transporter [Popillia japonica]|uniref:Sugar transporter n=1 Tax=Popillia japonica TaxID=7064 RepID=A0AAW1ISZ6_POPJA